MEPPKQLCPEPHSFQIYCRRERASLQLSFFPNRSCCAASGLFLESCKMKNQLEITLLRSGIRTQIARTKTEHGSTTSADTRREPRSLLLRSRNPNTSQPRVSDYSKGLGAFLGNKKSPKILVLDFWANFERLNFSVSIFYLPFSR